MSGERRHVLRRRGARVLPLDPRDRVLLVRGVDPSAPEASFWFTVGGGLEPGEGERAAAVRELREETGLVVGEKALVGPVHASADAFAFDGRWIEQSNVFFAVRVASGAAVGRVAPVPGEVARLEDRAWWTPGQLRAHVEGRANDGPGRAGEPVYPPTLPDVVEAARDALRRGGA